MMSVFTLFHIFTFFFPVFHSLTGLDLFCKEFVFFYPLNPLVLLLFPVLIISVYV